MKQLFALLFTMQIPIVSLNLLQKNFCFHSLSQTLFVAFYGYTINIHLLLFTDAVICFPAESVLSFTDARTGSPEKI